MSKIVVQETPPAPETKVEDGVTLYRLDFGDGVERWSPVAPQAGRDFFIKTEESDGEADSEGA